MKSVSTFCLDNNMFHRVSEKMINFFADTMRISAVLNIQDSGLVVTQIFLYFPLFDFGMECCIKFITCTGTLLLWHPQVNNLPVSTNAKDWKSLSAAGYVILHAAFYKTMGCWSLFQPPARYRGEFPVPDFRQISTSPAPGNQTPAARFRIIEMYWPVYRLPQGGLWATGCISRFCRDSLKNLYKIFCPTVILVGT